MFSDIVIHLAAVISGGFLGYAFGLLQQAALRKNELRQQQGNLKSGWSLMPGAGARVAYFLVALLLVQLICPLLFRDGTQWWVSGGVLAGYGSILVAHLRRRRREARA
ncbi:MAG TPA: hypothetical protein VHD32_13975 [Candidatus Didemnitutus sp.]|nr:hypothetical protein [Candidatus Didemnitutus sp.]